MTKLLLIFCLLSTGCETGWSGWRACIESCRERGVESYESMGQCKCGPRKGNCKK